MLSDEMQSLIAGIGYIEIEKGIDFSSRIVYNEYTMNGLFMRELGII